MFHVLIIYIIHIEKITDTGELHDLYGKPDIVRIVKSRWLRWAGHVTRMGNERGAWKLLVGKPGGKRPVGRPRMRWENNRPINHDLREVDYTGDDWKTLAEDREVWTVTPMRLWTYGLDSASELVSYGYWVRRRNIIDIHQWNKHYGILANMQQLLLIF